MPHDAHGEYRDRMAAREATRAALDDSDARLAHARLATVAAAIVVGILAWRTDLSAWWLLAPAAVFVWLARRHDRVLRAREAATRAIAFYARGLARLEDRWVGTGEAGERLRDDRHVYANDLDLFGRGSLFELLSLARTRAGEDRLAGWLTAPAEPAEIRMRQRAVEELGPALDLREQLGLAGSGLRESVNTDRLLAWAEAPIPPAAGLRRITWTFTVVVGALILYLAIAATWWPLAAAVVLQSLAFRLFREPMDAIVSGRDSDTAGAFVADALTHRARDLDVVADLSTHLENAGLEGDRLQSLQRALTADGQPASGIMRRLHRLAETHASTANTAILPLGLFLLNQIELALGVSACLLLVRPHLALAVERWRRRHGPRVRVWLDTIAEFEALTSLAAYRYEHADDPFPAIVSPEADDARPTALFDGVQLGHPLLPAATMVRNDVRLGGGTALLVVSGSNMSGKSTLLRTVGINTVLALAGAPVRAASLRLSPLALGATLRIQDSLLEGRSRFYAEITRIRDLAELSTGRVPLLFLLDELFHGTNSHDRRLGAAGVLASLLDRGAIGLITTHDLAMTSLVDELSRRAANVHFQDSLDGHEIAFDYRMKPGPVTRSNALALMRAVGLAVAAPAGLETD